ncbi:MAG: hypothetical protein Tsb0026_01710 [Sulfuricaulis sp.]
MPVPATGMAVIALWWNDEEAVMKVIEAEESGVGVPGLHSASRIVENSCFRRGRL